jgi:hypothetical protein
MNALKKLNDQLTHLNNNLPPMGDIPKQIGFKKKTNFIYLINIEIKVYFRFIKRCT